MKIEQIYTGCLAQGAYYIESDGEAVVIDPLREVDPYIQKAERNGAAIKYVLETHFHADFVSGHLDLSQKTGAQIVYGPHAKPAFDFSMFFGLLMPLFRILYISLSPSSPYLPISVSRFSIAGVSNGSKPYNSNTVLMVLKI